MYRLHYSLIVKLIELNSYFRLNNIIVKYIHRDGGSLSKPIGYRAFLRIFNYILTSQTQRSLRE